MSSKKIFIQDLAELLTCEIEKIIRDVEIGEVKTSLSKGTLMGYKKGLILGLNTWPKNKYQLLEKLKLNGLNALLDRDYWVSIEIASFKYLGKFNQPFTRALHTYLILTARDEFIERPTAVVIDGAKISLLNLYACNEAIGAEFMEASKSLITIGTQANSTKKVMIQSVSCALNDFLSVNNNQRNLISTFEGISSGHVASASKMVHIRTSIKGILECYHPESHRKKIIKIGSLPINVSKVSKLSPVIIQQLKALALSSYFSGSLGHREYSLKSRLSHALRVIIKFAGENYHFQSEFKKNGLNCFLFDDHKFLKELRIDVSRRDYCAIRNVIEHFSGFEIVDASFVENMLLFNDAESDLCRTLDISSLAVFGEKIIHDFKFIQKSEMELLSQKSYGYVTLITRFSKLHSLLTKYGVVDVLKDYGINCFGFDNGAFQLEVLMKIQQDVNRKKISRRTGEAYVSAVRWVCEITNQKFKNAYRISSNRHAIYAKRLSLADTYSEEDIREIAYYLEKLISNKECSNNDLIALYFARIQLKTCWNTSSLSRIECDDVIEVDFPTKSKPISVLLQKPRKGYLIDHFEFDTSIAKSAIHDLLLVKNDLTSAIRKKYRNEPFVTRIFIMEIGGKVKPIKFETIVKRISDLLTKSGCSIKYNSAKLRKTGANFIYDQVSKDIGRYKDALKHSYATFLKHYQRINEVTTQTTLHDAASIMEQYFTGKEICSDIKIVTGYDSDTQITPVGLCVATKNSTDSKRYSNSHIKFTSITESDRCSDFLACIWCKNYRVVADAEHAWQLLSFKNYVLSDMESATASFSENSLQKQAINALSNRVDLIIGSLKKANDKAVNEAFNLIKNNGMHPSWGFVAFDEGVYS